MERHHENVRIDKHGFAFFVELTQSSNAPYAFKVKVTRYTHYQCTPYDERLLSEYVMHEKEYTNTQFHNAYRNFKYHLKQIKKL